MVCQTSKWRSSTSNLASRCTTSLMGMACQLRKKGQPPLSPVSTWDCKPNETSSMQGDGQAPTTLPIKVKSGQGCWADSRLRCNPSCLSFGHQGIELE